MKIYRLIFITLLSLSFIGSYGQNQDQDNKKIKSEKSVLRKANKEYEKFSYVKTTELLLELANSGYKSEDLYQKLGNSYYFNNKMEDAAKWYKELMILNDNQEDTEYYFRYAQALKVLEKYEESDLWMNKFFSNNEGDLRAIAYKENKNYIKQIEAKKKSIKLHNLDINSPNSDFGAAQYHRQLVFASSRQTIDTFDKKKRKIKNYVWNDQPFLNLYSAKKKNDSSYTKVKAFNTIINTEYHESSASFTPNQKIMFFTRNNYFKDKYKDDSQGTNRLKLFRAILQDTGKWGEIESIHFNSDEYSVAHPSLNADGTKIYFASDMPGTVGLSDIYVADVNRDGTLEEPVNLGIAINTEGKETFPFINEKGDLYFSSNGLPGLGDLDIYVIRDFENKYENHKKLVPENLGKPFNSSSDDFAYFENFDTNEGFLSSNRPGGKGDDDIYSFKTYQDCKQEVKGVVVNKKTGALLPFATVTLFDSAGTILQKITAGADADFYFNLDCDTQYLVRGQKAKYSSDEKRITTPITDLKLNLELGLELNLTLELESLEPETGPYPPGTLLNKYLGINIIYFDFDKDFIRSPDATRELQKVILFMKSYPSVHVDVRSHTDSRATNAYNDDLSARRNKSTIDYIVNAGISRDRLTGRGYGETQLVNECADGVKCSEDKHDLNRRSEFIVTKQ